MDLRNKIKVVDPVVKDLITAKNKEPNTIKKARLGLCNTPKKKGRAFRKLNFVIYTSFPTVESALLFWRI